VGEEVGVKQGGMPLPVSLSKEHDTRSTKYMVRIEKVREKECERAREQECERAKEQEVERARQHEEYESEKSERRKKGTLN
jgi:hypothetical protein